MARIRHLQRAPVVEAVIELRVRPRNGIASETFGPLADRLRPLYPTIQKVQSLEATFGIREGKPIAPDTTYEELGVLLKSVDEREVVQLRTNGFSFSRLPPYTSWEDVLPKAIALWMTYREVALPDGIVRLGVRYINRLSFPVPVDLATFLAAHPIVPEMLPQALRSYLTRVVLHDANDGNSVMVTQASEASSDQEHLNIVLDVDAFREVDLVPNDDRIPERLESLRNLKNRAFFGSITERTAEMYE